MASSLTCLLARHCVRPSLRLASNARLQKPLAVPMQQLALNYSQLTHHHEHQQQQSHTLGLSSRLVQQQIRFYGAPPPMTMEIVRKRVHLVLCLYDKIDPEKVTMRSHFYKDLGLDSLDMVEVMLAMEDEFGFEIPEEMAEKLITPEKIAEFVCDHEDIYE